MKLSLGVSGPQYTLYSCVSVLGGGGGNLVPRRDKGSFYILELVPGSRRGMAEGGQVDMGISSFLLLNKQLGGS